MIHCLHTYVRDKSIGEDKHTPGNNSQRCGWMNHAAASDKKIPVNSSSRRRELTEQQALLNESSLDREWYLIGLITPVV